MSLRTIVLAVGKFNLKKHVTHNRGRHLYPNRKPIEQQTSTSTLRCYRKRCSSTEVQQTGLQLGCVCGWSESIALLLVECCVCVALRKWSMWYTSVQGKMPGKTPGSILNPGMLPGSNRSSGIRCSTVSAVDDALQQTQLGVAASIHGPQSTTEGNPLGAAEKCIAHNPQCGCSLRF